MCVVLSSWLGLSGGNELLSGILVLMGGVIHLRCPWLCIPHKRSRSLRYRIACFVFTCVISKSFVSMKAFGMLVSSFDIVAGSSLVMILVIASNQRKMEPLHILA